MNIEKDAEIKLADHVGEEESSRKLSSFSDDLNTEIDFGNRTTNPTSTINSYSSSIKSDSVNSGEEVGLPEIDSTLLNTCDETRPSEPAVPSTLLNSSDGAGPSEPAVVQSKRFPKEIVPTVPENEIPQIGATFSSMNETIDAYRRYASISGFGVRLGTLNLNKEKTFETKYVRCSRYGENKKKPKRTFDNHGKKRQIRITSYKRCGCQARIVIRRQVTTEVYKISAFEPKHNHSLCKGEDNPTIKRNKGLTFMEKDLVMKASTLNIGPTRAYKLNACFKGGYDNITASKNDYTNFWRDYTSIVGPNDAQWVVDQLTIRKNNYPNFFFKYELDGPVLKSLFWADELAKENYTMFSDAISMDATYRTNRYNMIFVPFTAINNHNKSVNVGSGLLSHETVESYTWLLKSFLEAHGHAPRLILSDQDPALNQSISKIFTDSTHRLCMWHIMQKLQGKIADDVLVNTEFKKRIHKLVWSIHLDIAEFEKKWASMISEFKLEENKWLHDMYQIRDRWIPGYFRHIPMCGLMKTTSRSESANSFFNTFTNVNSLLVNFMFNYDTAVTKQRYEQHENDVSSNTSTPTLISAEVNAGLELHAALVYTKSMFLKVQKELKKAQTLCHQETFVEDENWKEFTIVYRNHKDGSKPKYKVRVQDSFNSVECSCRRFNNFGYLCCHAFVVLLNNDIKEIPAKYISKRWQKNIIELTKTKMCQKWGIFNNETSHLVEEALRYFERCIEKVVHNKDKLRELICKLKELDISIEVSVPSGQQGNTTKHYVKEVVGVDIEKPVEIENPSGITNKGGSRRTRMKSAKEKAISKSHQHKRICQGCLKPASHDKRNCPINPSNKLKPHKKIRK